MESGRRSWRAGARAGLLAALCLAGAAPVQASLPVPEAAFAEGAFDGEQARIEARLLFHPDDVVSGGPVRVGVLLDMDAGWHVYWRNPGQSGLPTQLRWRAEDGFVEPQEWPAPTAFRESDGELTTYGYADRVLLAGEVSFRHGEAAGRRVSVQVEALACGDQCIPARFLLERRLGDALAAEAGPVRALFEAHARTIPRTPEALGIGLEPIYSQSAIRPGDAFSAALGVWPCQRPGGDGEACDDRLGSPEAAIFFPDRLDTIALEVEAVGRHPDDDRALLVSLGGRASLAEPADSERLRGVLTLGGADEPRHVAVDLPLPRVSRDAVVRSFAMPEIPRAGAASGGVLAALGLALLGGLLLNLMPCVLPVLAIKVLAVAELAQRSRREVVWNGLAYAAGILTTLGLLAGLVVALRAAGTAVGWGFQFQEPLFVAAISAVLVVFALNLFGAFEIHSAGGRLATLGSGAKGVRRSFLDGLLAVVLATPCSAPFLGTAVGFAFASPPLVVFAIFCCIGLGLAAPFVLVTWVPASARLVPRSGPWTQTLRVALGFALLGTVVWLLWILGRMAGVEAVVTLLAFLLALAVLAWGHGVLQGRGVNWLPIAGGVLLLAVALVGPDRLRLHALPEPGSGVASGTLPAQPFDAQRVAAELAHGRRVFVYFTADWCITCKVNERLVLSDGRVRAELERLDVAVFRADWTRRDERIRAELARFGRAGVPMYLVHHPEAPEQPIVLGELLSVERLLDALREPGTALAAS